VTVDEVTSWQRHTVRGLFFGNPEKEAQAHPRLRSGGAWPGLPHRRGPRLTQSCNARPREELSVNLEGEFRWRSRLNFSPRHHRTALLQFWP
jgi:hypothetical protein